MIGQNAYFQTPRTGHSHGYGTGNVTRAIRQASQRTGVDFDYLIKQANVESSMNPNAKARTSSATGLYQFIEQTWLRMIKNHGAAHGYGTYADAISQDRSGTYHVSGRAMRNTILNLRKDPQASSLMAAELATENNSYLRQATGQQPNETDLYLAHFMGASGAANFLKSMKKNPWAPAASLFPDAARSNGGVFYAQGRPLSLQQIYNRFDAKFQGSGPSAPVQIRSAQTPVFDAGNRVPVRLPEAADWSRPNSIARRIAAGSGNSAASAAMADGFGHANNGLGQMGYLRSPVDVMFMAQADLGRFAHNNDDRYNS